MKDKEKQIEEMTKDLYGEIDYNVNYYTDDNYSEVDFDYKETAKNIVEKGWVKLPEDSVVLTREEYDELTLTKQSIFDMLEERDDKARKETAKDICDWLEYRFKLYDYVIEKPVKDSIKIICKKYGVEVEE